VVSNYAPPKGNSPEARAIRRRFTIIRANSAWNTCVTDYVENESDEITLDAAVESMSTIS